MNFSSQLLENAVEEFGKLPGIGKRTALRHVLFLLAAGEEQVKNLTGALLDLQQNVKYCRQCHNISDDYVCSICASPRRQHDTICVVEDARDVMAIENTQQYFGVYHVLGGLISPMDGVGPADLHIESLVERVAAGGVKEVILALNPNMEGDTTIFYISKKLEKTGVELSVIARGIAFGGQLEYADELTLGRSILTRVPYTKE